MVPLLLTTAVIATAGVTLENVISRRLGTRTVSLGALGSVRSVESQAWMRRQLPWITPVMMWTIWSGALIASATVCVAEPRLGWPLGLVLGGALANTVETSVRGSIRDYVCLRFWPAFNAADAAITLGAVSSIMQLAMVLAE